MFRKKQEYEKAYQHYDDVRVEDIQNGCDTRLNDSCCDLENRFNIF